MQGLQISHLKSIYQYNELDMRGSFSHGWARVVTSQFDLNSLTFSAHFPLTFPDLTTQICRVSHEILSEEGKKFAPATTGFLQKYA